MEPSILILGLVASILVVMLSAVKGQRLIAQISVALSAVLVVQYLILGQSTAATLSAMSMIYGILIFATVGRTDRFSKAIDSVAVRATLLGAYTVAFMLLNGGFGWNLQILAYIGSVLMVAVMMVSNQWTAKLILLFAGVAWTIFQWQTGAYANLIGQLFYFGGLVWSSWKLWNTGKVQRLTARSAIGLKAA